MTKTLEVLERTCNATAHSLKIPEGHLILMAPRVPARNSTHCTALPQYWNLQLCARYDTSAGGRMKFQMLK